MGQALGDSGTNCVTRSRGRAHPVVEALEALEGVAGGVEPLSLLG
jgi:hypothetical protein